jgi:uncharacterized 2Fe-2S/4Fe-4S cluster protein (DUF4445 family)
VGFRIRFLPDDRSVVLDEPLELSLAAARCGIWLEHPCGGTGTCGKCRVRVSNGDVPPSADDRLALPAGELAAGWRLGCRMLLTGPCEIEVPAQDRAAQPKSFGPDRLPAAPGEPQIPPRLMPPGGVPYGVAVDLGTTTLAAALVDLRDGRVLHALSGLNPQARYGADVMSRIQFARARPGGNALLHDAIGEGVAGLIRELAALAGASAEDVLAVTCVGNATMTHTAVGEEVSTLGVAPYLGVFTSEQEVLASALRWPVNPGARVRFGPMVRSHIGGDTVAGILACDLDRLDGWRVLVDLGTNAEIVVGGANRLVAASTAAGPAFDGVNISCGMRAASGAVDAVVIRPDGHLSSTTIGGAPAIGLCGSGLVDATAELLRAGVIAPSGHMRSAEECRALGVPDALLDRLVPVAPGRRAFRIDGRAAVTAADIRQLQLAKGSIAAGLALLMRRIGVDAGSIAEVLVAGTFGTFLRKESLMAIGLLPAVDPERIRFVGNAAGAGARLMLADGHARRRAAEAAARCEYVELAGDPAYEAAFTAALGFPRSGSH